MTRLDLVRPLLGSTRPEQAARPDLRVEAAGAPARVAATVSSFENALLGRAFAFGAGRGVNPGLQQARAAASYLAESTSASRAHRRPGVYLREEG